MFIIGSTNDPVRRGSRHRADRCNETPASARYESDFDSEEMQKYASVVVVLDGQRRRDQVPHPAAEAAAHGRRGEVEPREMSLDALADELDLPRRP